MPEIRWGLAAGFDDQDHSGVEDGYVAIVALERRDRRVVGGGDRVEGFAVLHGVAEDGGLAGGVFVGVVCGPVSCGSRDLGRLPGMSGWVGGGCGRFAC